MPETAGLIAIVDDDPSVLRALERLLRVRGLQCLAYARAEEFLESLDVKLPDCLILDLQMPGMTGLEVLQSLKRRAVHIPTIIITAHSDPGARQRCESAGAAAFLSKPLRNSTLLAAIEAVAKSSGAR